MTFSNNTQGMISDELKIGFGLILALIFCVYVYYQVFVTWYRRRHSEPQPFTADGVADMTNKPRDWPNVARLARDRAAEECQIAVQQLTKLLEPGITEAERYQRTARALNSVHTALRFLESVGAQTRPE